MFKESLKRFPSPRSKRVSLFFINRIERNIQQGFTLLEMLVVLVVFGVIASLAVPIYSANLTNTKKQEALMAIGALRNSLTVFYCMNGNSYAAVASDCSNLTYNPNAANGSGQTVNFSYSITNLTQETYRITAAMGVAGTVVTDQAGNVSYTGVFA